MGCSACKVGTTRSSNQSTSIKSDQHHHSIAPDDRCDGGNGSVLRGVQASPSVPLAASVSSTAASPHHQHKKESVVTTPLTNDKSQFDTLRKEPAKLNGALTKTTALDSKTPSYQATPDLGEISPKGLTVAKPNDSANSKGSLQRNLSSCRLKKSKDITEVYDISNNQVLGTGISGAVRLATHKLSGRRFAIKTLSLESVGAKKSAMLHNEVSIYLKLDHPNIARLVEVYETHKSIHLVMELCTGGELYDRLAAKKKYREADAANVTRQMLSAINYCHQHHICHRDLKLENWVYADKSEDAPLKLIDFGFSRIFNPGVPMTAMHGTVYYVSPEVMDGCYQEKCDIWSIGVIVYMLLSGSPPFNGSYDHEILVKIKRGHFGFSGPRWQGISNLAKQFILYLLQRDPDVRPSAEEALKHPWLTPQLENSTNGDIDLQVVKSMRDFALGNVLRRAAVGVVALTMTSREVEELEKQFKALDRTNRGTIQLQDLAKVLKEKLNIDTAEAQRIFDRIDQTGSREVHYSEFIASTLQAKVIKDDTLIKEAFQRFDLDKKQAITLENLRAVIGDSYNGSQVEEIMELCDTNGDGVIDFDEFYKALTSDEAALSNSFHGTNEKQKSGIELSVDGLNRESRRYISRRSSDDFSSDDAGIKARESAFTALQSMRKATCLSAVSDAEGRFGHLW